MEDKTVLLGLSSEELENWAIAQGHNSFRGRQLHKWIYEKGAKTLNEITVLPKAWRFDLENEGVRVGRLKEIKRSIAHDSTLKLLLSTQDSETIETVGIPTRERLTVCVSSQVGCPMDCQFCATGQGGFRRSLMAHEIVDQVLSVREVMQRRPSHVVFMGMGEPLLNIEEVLAAIRCLGRDLSIGHRKITISTVGVHNTLPKLAELSLRSLGRAQFTLALSLHAPNQKLRETLIPTAKNYPINNLLDDCKKYFNRTGRRVSFEYILLGSLNDSVDHAKELAALLDGFKSHINLIAYNPIDNVDFKRPDSKCVEMFKQVLEQRGVVVTLRASRGLDQNAACGQLRSQHAKFK